MHDRLTVPAAIGRVAERHGDHEALVEDDRRWTWSEVVAEARLAARGFVANGVAPGDRVALWAPNISEWVFASMGLQLIGAVIVPLNTRYKGSEAADIIARSGARTLLTVTDFLDTDYVAMLDAAGRPDDLDAVVALRGTPPTGASPWGDYRARAEEVTDDRIDALGSAVSADDLSDIMFTSGTTGAPKGAMLRHGATVRAFTEWAEVIGLRADDRYLIINPFFHSFGMKAGILASVLTGATMVPHLVFDVPSVMKRIVDERISVLPGPPAIYQTMLNRDDLDAVDLSTLRLAVTGAAPIPPEMIVAMKERLGFETVVTAYGLTEAHGFATICRAGDDAQTIANTSGRAITDVEVQVVDDAHVELPRGEAGEIVIRGYNVMSGYLDDPDATAEAIDRDGWLHTGDVGVMDERGYIDITDRKKDMFIVGGFNAYPAEIEAAMMRHPDIGQAAVIGVDDQRLGQVGMAFVVPRPGAAIASDEVIAWCREQMANFKVPREVRVVDALPTNASNKVLKTELRSLV